MHSLALQQHQSAVADYEQKTNKFEVKRTKADEDNINLFEDAGGWRPNVGGPGEEDSQDRAVHWRRQKNKVHEAKPPGDHADKTGIRWLTAKHSFRQQEAAHAAEAARAAAEAAGGEANAAGAASLETLQMLQTLLTTVATTANDVSQIKHDIASVRGDVSALQAQVSAVHTQLSVLSAVVGNREQMAWEERRISGVHPAAQISSASQQVAGYSTNGSHGHGGRSNNNGGQVGVGGREAGGGGGAGRASERGRSSSVRGLNGKAGGSKKKSDDSREQACRL